MRHHGYLSNFRDSLPNNTRGLRQELARVETLPAQMAYRVVGATALLLLCALCGVFAHADDDVTATELKIGNTAPYSGPLSRDSTMQKAEAAYFRKVNDAGGINGRKLVFISYDDGYSPPRTYEMTRRLVEQDHVLLLFSSLGTPTNAAVWKYLNDHQVPQLFLESGASKWGDPKGHPWTIGFRPTYYGEGNAWAQYVLRHIPDARVGILYQNDDLGKDFVSGFKGGLGAAGKKLIVMEQTYEVSDPTIDSQIVNLKNSGANVFLNVTVGKFTSQAIRKVYVLGWHPVQFITSVESSISAVLRPAGLEASKGAIVGLYEKDPADSRWLNDVDVKDYLAFMKMYASGADPADEFNVRGYIQAHALVWVLRRCDGDLTRINIMHQATNMHDVHLAMVLPGIVVNTSPRDFYPLKQLQLGRFNGERWEPFGEVIRVKSGKPR